MSNPIKAGKSGTFGITNVDQRLGQRVDEFHTSAAVDGPAVVSLGTDGKVATSATNGTASLCVGVCINDPASGDYAKVVTLGIVRAVPCDGAIAAGDVVKRSVTTAGRVAVTATPALGEALGVALAASASNVCDIWVARSL